MIIAALILVFCLGFTMMTVAIVRSPLVRALGLSFECWAERTRFDVGELS